MKSTDPPRGGNSITKLLDRIFSISNWVPMAPDRVASLPNSIVALRQRAPQLKICNWVAKLSKLSAIVGKNGIRTRGVGWLPNALAKRRLKPLSHLSNLEFYDLQLSPRRGNSITKSFHRILKISNWRISYPDRKAMLSNLLMER